MDEEEARKKYLEIKKLFHRMSDLMCGVVESYYIWRTLTFSRSIPEVGQERAEKNANLLSLYKNFFIPTEQSHLQTFIIGLMKFFDKDPRTLSIRNLIKEIQKNKDIFTPEIMRSVHPSLEAIGAVADDYISIDQDTVDQVENIHKKYTALVDNLKNIRNTELAHTDMKVIKRTFVPNEIEDLIKAVQEMFNKLSGKFDLSGTIFDHLKNDTIGDTQFMLENLERAENTRREEIEKKWGTYQ